MKQFLSPSLFMCKCCFFNFRQRGDCHFNNLLAWIVLKIKEDVRHSILYHLFDCLPKSELVLTNSESMNTAYCFAIFHLKNKIIKTNIQKILFLEWANPKRWNQAIRDYLLTKMVFSLGCPELLQFYRMNQWLPFIQWCLMLSTTSCQSNYEENNRM